MNYEQKHPILQKLDEYFKNTPKEQIDKDWSDILKETDSESYYEQKYKKALERARECLQDGTITTIARAYIWEIFPELQEDNDERIRKAILELVRQSSEILDKQNQDNMIAWLKKQEEKTNPYSGVSFEYNGHIWGICARDNGVEILIDGHLDRVFTIDSNAKEMFIKALERVEEQNNKGYKLTDCDKNSWWEDFKAYTTSKQILANSAKTCKDEQKPADNIEPKFKVGDWVVRGKTIAQILDIQEQYYVGLDIDGNDFTSSRFLSDDKIHLWTIQDAKDGDVLDANGAPFIYKKHDKDYVYFYCGVNLAGSFIEANEIDIWNNNSKVYPATKEQRDLLFQKMEEAGWEWDAENKHLTKI